MSNPLSRRDVLRAGGAVALTPLARYASAIAPQDGAFTFVYLTDTHVALKRNIEENRAMLAEMRDTIRPEFAINGGDVTDYGWPGEYDNYDALLREVPFKVHEIPGNHDVRWSPQGVKIFRERVGAAYGSFDHKGCHFVLLDSTVPLSHWGHYESETLRWLEADLKKVGRKTPVFVTTHHWVGREKVMIDNENALLKVLEPYNVKLLLNGHGHSDLLWNWDGMVGTMNKGLYQGSYQKIEVDPAKAEVRLSRRTTERPEQRLLTTVPLFAPVEKRRVWALGEVTSGTAVPPDTEMRVNEGAFKPVEGGRVYTEELIPGSHVLTMRDPQGGRQASYPISVPTSPNSPLQPRWRQRLSGGVMSHLKLQEDRLFVSCMDGSVHALRRKDGKPLWRAKTNGYCHSSPVLAGRTLVVGSADAHVHAFDARSGKALWKFKTGGPVYASAAVANGVVAIASGDGRIYGLSLRDGKKLWQYEMPASNTPFAQSHAATDGERVYIGAWDSHLYALDLRTGALVWRKPCMERTFAFSPAIGGPAVANGRVFVPANGNGLFAFDAKTGEQLWLVSSPGDKYGHSSPKVRDGRIYVGCLGAKGEVRCVSAEDGKELWASATGYEIYDSSPALGDGFLGIGSVPSTLNVINLGDGKLLAQHRLPPGHFLSTPAADGRELYAATYSDEVVAFDVRA